MYCTRYSGDVTAADPYARNELLVADSFRVRVNEETGAASVRGFQLHLERFRQGITEMLGSEDFSAWLGTDWYDLVVDPFMETVAEQVYRGGEGFPRLELRYDPDFNAGIGASPISLDLRIRPLPKLGRRVELVSTSFEAARMPWVKGPNLSRHIALNRSLGAEALLLDTAGKVLEGASTAVIWWSDDALHVVDSPSRVSSICEHMVTAIATHTGIAVRRSTITPQALSRHEVWALNALHGIRPVTRIDGSPLQKPDNTRLAAFKRALDDTWEPIVP